MNVKHIAIVITGLGPGGAEGVLAQLARHWIEIGWRVTVISFDRPEDPVFHDFPRQAELVRLGRPAARGKIAGAASVLRRAIRLRNAIKQHKPKVVLSFLTKNNLLALVATLWMKLPVVCSERNNPERQDAHALWNRLLRLAYRRAALIVCQTRGVTRCLPGAVRHRVVVIPNPIPIRANPTQSRKISRIAAVGRLTHQKGFDILLAAFAGLHDRFSGWHLDVWGEGEEYRALDQLIRNYGLEGKATLRGTSERPGSWIEETDIFVLPSRYEGFPNVLAEAMVAGIPVVSAKCDFGPGEIITHDRDGLLVAPEDPDALAQGLGRLMKDAGLRERMGRRAAQSARRYAPDAILPKWDMALSLVMDVPAQSSSRSYVDGAMLGELAE